MIILGIDTSTYFESISLASNGKLISEYHENIKNHSPVIVNNIKNILSINNLTVHDVDVWGVSIGPGSFTGLRIGLASVLGITLPLKTKVVGVSTLKAMSLLYNKEGYISPMIDARKGEIYTALYKKIADNLHVIIDETVVAPDKWSKMLPNDNVVRVFGSGYDKYLENLDDSNNISGIEGFNLPISRGVVELAENFSLESMDFPVEPVYIRRSEAEINFNKIIE